MFLTTEELESRGACGVGLRIFNRLYPEGAEVSDIIKNPKMPKHLLHWGYLNLPVNEEEVDIYHSILNIDTSKNVFESDSVYESENVVGSSLIYTSKYIKNSKNIDSCVQVINSDIITNSEDVTKSKNISNSKNILECSNINDCIQAYNSKECNNSKFLYMCNKIRYSQMLFKCDDMTTSYFCANCSNSRALMFCTDLDNAELQLFNAPIKYTEFKKILLKYEEKWSDYVAKVSTPTTILNGVVQSGSPYYDFSRIYLGISDEFYEWVKTLPNYSDDIMYRITLDPQFLK